MIRAITYEEAYDKALEMEVDIMAIIQDYATSVLLYTLTKNNMLEKLIFKGGTAIKKAYFPDARYSVDLDFDSINPIKNLEEFKDNLISELENILLGIHGSIEIYELEPIITENWFFLNIKYRFFDLESISRLDIDKKVFSNKYHEITINNDPYIGENYTVKVYYLSQILEQKLLALIDRTNAKDLWDIYFLTNIKHATLDMKIREIVSESKLNIDKRKLEFIVSEIISEREFNVLRNTYLPLNYKSDFREVVKGVLGFIEEYW